MKYERPNLVVLASALSTIQSHTSKTTMPNGDLATGFVSNAAYEADE